MEIRGSQESNFRNRVLARQVLLESLALGCRLAGCLVVDLIWSGCWVISLVEMATPPYINRLCPPGMLFTSRSRRPETLSSLNAKTVG